jgi:hypothetical protein
MGRAGNKHRGVKISMQSYYERLKEEAAMEDEA